MTRRDWRRGQPIHWKNVLIWLAMLAICGLTIWTALHTSGILRLVGIE